MACFTDLGAEIKRKKTAKTQASAPRLQAYDWLKIASQVVGIYAHPSLGKKGKSDTYDLGERVMFTGNLTVKALPFVFIQLTPQPAFDAANSLVELSILIPVRHCAELLA